MTTPRCAKYSCASAAETLEWMSAIAFFLNPYKPLIDSHVVNFFKDRLWELVDDEWLRCLREEPVENLLRIPSGLVMEHWPVSLREFVLTIRSLVISRCQELPHQIFPDMLVPSLSSVLAQGMNTKKKHEVETLAAVVSVIASSVGAETVIDVGSGQGYLAQVLSFQYQLPVVAIDASSHHSSVTSARSERIKRHYAAKLRRSQSESRNLKVPCAVTCHVLSSSTLSALSIYCLRESFVEHDADTEKSSDLKSSEVQIAESDSGKNRIPMASLVLAGLHACGDLSVNMLRTFSECEQVKGLVCVGCCYNLLSEEGTQNFAGECGFPMSIGGKLSDLFLGKNARDLACQKDGEIFQRIMRFKILIHIHSVLPFKWSREEEEKEKADEKGRRRKRRRRIVEDAPWRRGKGLLDTWKVHRWGLLSEKRVNTLCCSCTK